MASCLGARPVRLAKGEVIFQEGEPAREMGLLLSGGARIIKEDFYGNRTIVARIEPGELFGESFACAQLEALPVSAVATEDSQVLLMDCRRLLTTCSNSCQFHNQLIFNLLKVVATKNILFHQRIEITAKRSTREKLLAYLVLQAKNTGSDSFEIPFDRQELADYLEVDRSGLSAEISKLRKEGILESQKNRFTLL
jgi:CRP-like cAMP-binding protein